MPAFPAFKTKPYYGALSDFLAVSIDLATGALKDTAVRPVVISELSQQPTVVDAAAAAVDANPTIATHTAAIARTDPGAAGAELQRLSHDGTEPVWEPPVSINAGHPKYGLPMDGTSDCTAAMTAIIADAAEWGTSQYIAIDMPKGEYHFHELEIPIAKRVLFRASEGAGTARFRYNGAGGAGSSLIRYRGRSNFGGIIGIPLFGTDAAMTTMAENLIQMHYVDHLFVLHDIMFSACFGDAILLTAFPDGETTSLTSGSVMAACINWHIDKVRFDSVGGWGINIDLDLASGHSGHPVTLSRWTIDNNLSGSTLTLATSLGHYDGTHWGKGVIRAEQANGLNITVDDARIEINKPLIRTNGRTALFLDSGTSGGGANWEFDNLSGYSWQSDNTALLEMNQPRVGYTIGQNGLPARTYATRYVPDVTSRKNGYRMTGAASFGGRDDGGHVGIRVSGQLVESRNNKPGGSQWGEYRYGDIVLHNDPIPGTNSVGWIATAPTSGAGASQAISHTTQAIVTSGSATIDLSVPASKTYGLIPGSAITIVGAGVAGADLNTTITSVDIDMHTITVAATPSTSVNPATIKAQVVTWREFGDIAGYGTAAPTTGTYAKGEKIWNTNPTAGGYVGWVCVTTGTPGTWKGFGAIEP